MAPESLPSGRAFRCLLAFSTSRLRHFEFTRTENTRLQVEVSQIRRISDSCVFTTTNKLTYTQSSDRVAMAGAPAEVLLRQLLQNQTQILARLDTVDEKLKNLTAGQDQLSAS